MPKPALDLLPAYREASRERLFDGFAKIQHCVSQLTEDQIWWRPAPEMNSIANLLLHLAGNLRQWLINGLTGAPDDRQRQSEFDDRSRRSGDELLSALRDTISEASEVISQQSSDELLRVRRVQQFDIDGFQTIQDSVGHFQGHVQEIIHMTRCQLGAGYQFHFVPAAEPNRPSPGSRAPAPLAELRPLEDCINEFRRLKKTAEGALADLTDEHFFASPGEAVNSIALIVKHVAGNLTSRWSDFLTTDGEKANRHRDQEFVLVEGDDRSRLLQSWEGAWQILDATLSDLSEEQLGQTITIRGEPHSVHEAILRSLAHTAYHVGQIVYLRRMHQPDGDWLTIAPGKSDQHAGNYLKP